MRVFLSYPHQEKDTAYHLATSLKQAGLEPILDSYDSGLGDEILQQILYSVESSDFVLLLIPSDSSMEGRWLRSEISKALRFKLKSRNVSIVPVFLGRRPLLSSFSGMVSFSIDRDLEGDAGERAIKKIVSYLANLPRVQFDQLSIEAFESLVVALLRKLRFTDIERNSSRDYGFDITAQTRARNPFGGFGSITWLIELKFRKDSRADINSLRQLSYYLENEPIGVNGVLITNGQLTSTAREWVEVNQKSKRTSITIVDGTQLREIVLKYPDLVDEFFGGGV